MLTSAIVSKFLEQYYVDECRDCVFDHSTAQLFQLIDLDNCSTNERPCLLNRALTSKAHPEGRSSDRTDPPAY
jgi:hypothetical protein